MSNAAFCLSVHVFQLKVLLGLDRVHKNGYIMLIVTTWEFNILFEYIVATNMMLLCIFCWVHVNLLGNVKLDVHHHECVSVAIQFSLN